ncbi:hypothetical protein SLA2020_405020 [Shorea laevis]
MYDARRLVDLGKQTCTCGRWQLNVFLADMLVVQYLHKHKPEDYLDGCYSVSKYIKAYDSKIHAMPGPEEWPPAVGCDDILPPNVRVQPG